MYDGLGTPAVTPKLAEVMRVVAKAHGITVDDLKSPCRKAVFAWPRQKAQYLCRAMTRHSYPEIGRAFGGRDHTTVLFAYRKVAAKAACSDSLAEELAHYRRDITALAEVRQQQEQELRASLPEPAPAPYIKPVMLGSRWSDEQLRALRTLRQEGLAMCLIAERLGRSEKAVSSKVCRVGLARVEA